MALNYKQHICRQLKLEKYVSHQPNFMSNVFILIYSDGAWRDIYEIF
jgi:hypothetical protein